MVVFDSITGGSATKRGKPYGCQTICVRTDPGSGRGVTSPDGVASARLESPIGQIEVSVNEEGLLLAVKFLDQDDLPATESDPGCGQVVRQLEQYFAGERTIFDLEVDPSGSDFERRVWDDLVQIPYGSTETYGAIARRLGDPGASRAVGTANARNPIAIIVPCHRVIGSGGELTGYAGGLWRKKWLLAHESGQGSLDF